MFIDIHSHLVFGVDDGPADEELSRKMIGEYVKDNVSHVIATPHMVPGQEEFFAETYLENLQKLSDYCKNEQLPIEIHPGAEVFYTASTPRFLREGRIQTLAGSNFVLLEFGTLESFKNIQSAADAVLSAGYIPVFAHIERYKALNNLKNVALLKENGHVVMQVNAGAVLEANKPFHRKWVLELLKAGLADVVASDSHNVDTRRTHMTECADILTKRLGKDRMNELMYLNQAGLFKMEKALSGTEDRKDPSGESEKAEKKE